MPPVFIVIGAPCVAQNAPGRVPFGGVYELAKAASNFAGRIVVVPDVVVAVQFVDEGGVDGVMQFAPRCAIFGDAGECPRAAMVHAADVRRLEWDGLAPAAIVAQRRKEPFRVTIHSAASSQRVELELKARRTARQLLPTLAQGRKLEWQVPRVHGRPRWNFARLRQQSACALVQKSGGGNGVTGSWKEVGRPLLVIPA